MTVQSVVFLSLLCCSICVSHQWSDTLPKTQGMIAQGCEIALSPLQSDSGARLFGVLPVLDGIELLKGCTVVKSAVSRSVSETGIEVRAIFVHPASKQRQRWNVTQPVVAAYLPEEYHGSQLRVWMNCSSLYSPSETVWRIFVACTANLLSTEGVATEGVATEGVATEDESVVSVQLSRMRRDSEKSQKELQGGRAWKWEYAIVVTVAFLLSFTIMIVLCVKKQSLDVTRPSNSVYDVTAPKDAEKNHNKVDQNSSVPNEETNKAIEDEKETTEHSSVSERGKQEEHSEVAGSEQTSANDVIGSEQRQVDDEEAVEARGTSGSGTMTVPEQEMFSGDGYALVRGYSETADRLVTVEEDSGSSGDEQHTDDVKGNKTEQEASSTDWSADLERSGKHRYTKVSTGSTPQSKLKSTQATSDARSAPQSKLKSTQATSDARSAPLSKLKSTHATSDVRSAPRSKLKSTQATSDTRPAPQLNLKLTQATTDAPPPAHIVRRFKSSTNNKSAERAPAVPPDEPRSPFLSRTIVGSLQEMEEVDMESQSEPQVDTDLYSKVDEKTSEEDSYSNVDRTANENDMYSSIEEAQSGADQQPPPLPPTNKFSKSTSVLDKARKTSRDEPLPPTPFESSVSSVMDHVFPPSSSTERGRSYTANDAISSSKDDPPYAKPFARSNSETLASEGEGQPVRDLLELYAKVDITKKKKNQPVDEQHVAPLAQNVDELYAKPYKPGKGSLLTGASFAENIATAELAEDGYSCVKKPERSEPNYSEVGPAVRSSPGARMKERGYASVDVLTQAEPPAVPDPGYEKVGQNSDVVKKASNSPDPGYDNISDHSDDTGKGEEPDYENVRKVTGYHRVDKEENETTIRKETEISPSLDPNYDEIDEDFREQIQQFRERSESRDEDEDT